MYFEGFDKIGALEKEEKKPVKSHERSKKSNHKDKISFPADIPVEQHIIDLSEEEIT
jgi:hypothetical protein